MKYDAVHARDRGMRGLSDHEVLEYCLSEDRVIVTHDANDFRRLVGDTEIHSGLIVFEESGREQTWAMMESTLVYLGGQANPEDYMINRVLSVRADGSIAEDFELPDTTTT